MSPDDMKALGRELAPVIQKYVGEAVRAALLPVESRLSAVETRPLARDGVGITGFVKSDHRVLILTLSDGKILDTGIRDGVDGKDGVAGRDGKDGAAGQDGKDGRDGKDGKDADPQEVAALIEVKVAEAVGALPPAEDHSEGPTIDEVKVLVDASVARAIEAIPAAQPGRDGKDADPRAVAAIVEDSIAAITPKLISSVSARVLSEIPEARPGRDGRDGQPGVPGPSGPAGLDGTNGVDGINGTDGRDGLGFDDMVEELDADGRTIVRRYSRGDRVVEFRHRFGVVLYRGVWRDGDYVQGDAVTWGGSIWVAQRDTSSKPAEGSDDWKLAVKRGRDGKDGKPPVELAGPIPVGRSR